jgi:colanic acid/amylovoran biosynthesis glycosyltransferase
MTARPRIGRPVVAVYRALLLPLSETFVRREALALERYAPVFVGEGRVDGGLELPDADVVVGIRGGRYRHAVLSHVPGYLLRRLERACREREVALVHAHFGTDSLRALDLAERLDVPFVVSYQGFDAALSDAAMRAGPHADYLRRRAELFEKAAAIIAVSQWIAGELVRQGAPEEKLHVHHVGAPLGPPPPDRPRAPVVLFVGRHVEKKGLGDLIDAMARVRAAVPGASLLVIGDGPLRSEIEAHARRLEVDARFVGWLAAHEVEGLFREARVLCVPSRRAANGDAEGLPTVIAEAGGHGLPIVGTRHSGIPEALGDESGGLLADEGDVEGIARALIAVLTDDDLWRRLSAGARDNVARNFDPDRQVAELEGIYDEARGRATSR